MLDLNPMPEPEYRPVDETMLTQNIEAKMDVYNDHFRNRNGKIKSSKILLAEEVPNKHKFNLNYDYTKSTYY